MVNLSKFSLYTTVAFVVLFAVVIVASIHSSYNYLVVKEKFIEQMKEDSKLTIHALRKNLESMIASYSVNEYDTLVHNQIERRNFLAIVVEDNKMGQILGKVPFVSGAIRDNNNQVVDFNPEDTEHIKKLSGAYYVQQYNITTSSGDNLGDVKIYVSGQLLDEKLDRMIISTIIDVVVLSIFLTLALFLMLRIILLKPLYDLNRVITKTDEDGLPMNEIPKTGTLEMVTLASAMEKMTLSIKESQAILKDEHDRLVESESQLLLMLELSPIAVRISTMDGKNVIFANLAYGELIHINRDEIIGKNPHNYYHEPKVYEEILNRLYHNERIYNETVELMVEGKQLWALASYTLITFQGDECILGWFYNITDQKETELKLQYSSNHDVLTGLPNRALLSSIIPRILARSKRNGTYAALLFIDLDGFKKVNDDHGHETGDLLLKDVALRLNSLVRGDDIVSRIGGDEFTVMIGDINTREEIVPLIQRILDTLNEPFSHTDHLLFISASIGVSFYPQEVEVDADTLLRQADQAMYEAKVRGKNQFAYYDEINENSYENTIDSASSIKKALENDEFILYYQPKVQMSTGKVLGAEALIRWNDPVMGMVYPDEFLPIIENRPLMYALDQWVFKKAVSQLSEWNKNNFFTNISINFSAYSLKQPLLLSTMDSILADYPNVLPSQIEVEILETSALHDINEIQKVIDILHAKGMTIALDDFGTGYSTLSYLKKLNIDYLKLDKSFVMDMSTNASDLSILDATLGLAHAFNFKVIAEGVESIVHGNLLIQFGCDYAQGYAIARPMPPETFLTWSGEWKSIPAWTSTQKISSNLIPLLYASVEHRSWFKNLENYWNNQDPFPPKVGEYECRFGDWLLHQGPEFFNDEKEYVRIQKLHHNFHDLASQLVTTNEESTRGQLWNVIYSVHLDLLKMIEQKTSKTDLSRI